MIDAGGERVWLGRYKVENVLIDTLAVLADMTFVPRPNTRKREQSAIGLTVNGEPMLRRGRPSDVLHHSDRGSQYTSELCQRLMAEYGVVCSLSRSGTVLDKAAMESFFSTLKTERMGRKDDRTRDAARADVFDYIERFYHPKRRHSTLGYISPVVDEDKMRLA